MTKLVTQSLMSVCAILLLLSSLEHLSNPFRFLDGVMAYKLVSFSTARFIATSLPAVSLLTGIALMTGSMRLGGLAMTVLLCLSAAVCFWLEMRLSRRAEGVNPPRNPAVLKGS